MRGHTREEVEELFRDFVESNQLTAADVVAVRDLCLQVVLDMRQKTAKEDVQRAAEKGFNS